MSTKVSGKGQVVIPKDVRQRLRLAPGDLLDVIERTDGVLLRKAKRAGTESFEDLTARIRARVSYQGPVVTIDEMNQSIAEMAAKSGETADL